MTVMGFEDALCTGEGEDGGGGRQLFGRIQFQDVVYGEMDEKVDDIVRTNLKMTEFVLCFLSYCLRILIDFV